MTTYYTSTAHPIGRSGIVDYGGGLALYVMDQGTTYAGLEGSPAGQQWLRAAGVAIGGWWAVPMDHVLKPGLNCSRFLLGNEVDQGTIDVLCSIERTDAVGTSDAWTTVDSVTANGIGAGQRYDTSFIFQSAFCHGPLYSTHYRYRTRAEITGVSGSPAQWGLYALDWIWSASSQALLVGDATA